LPVISGRQARVMRSTRRGDGFKPVHATRAKQQFGALSAESPCGGGAKTAGGARDQNPFIGEIR
jgi:hypothetical protein